MAMFIKFATTQFHLSLYPLPFFKITETSDNVSIKQGNTEDYPLVIVSSGNQRREMKRSKRQSESNLDAEDLEAAAEEVNTRSPTAPLTQGLDLQPNETRPMGQETDQTLNPDNPYNVSICSIISFQSPRLL